jgi:hypothetical protein
MENQFAEFYQSFIQNSLFPKELEDYNKALKTLKLTPENFLDLLQDLDNHIIEVEGEIIPDLSKLAQSKLFINLGSYENSKLKKDKEAIKILNQHLLVFFGVVNNYNLKKGVVNDDYNRKIENANKVIFDRFVHLNNSRNEDIKFKGQLSFILKNPIVTKQIRIILDSLKKNDCISKKTSQVKFQNIFLGLSIPNEDKVDWEGSKKELSVFVKALKHKLIDKNYIYDTVQRCFTINGKEIIKTTEISNASGSTLNEQIIKDIVKLF